jgi:hypothetical protein
MCMCVAGALSKTSAAFCGAIQIDNASTERVARKLGIIYRGALILCLVIVNAVASKNGVAKVACVVTDQFFSPSVVPIGIQLLDSSSV